MRYYELYESGNKPLIVVDVQPEYSGMNDGEENHVFPECIQFANSHNGKILMLCNAEAEGLSNDTVTDIKIYWEDNGFDPNNWNKVEVVDKGYGYLRSWMDMSVSESTIIKTIRLMYQNKVNDSRMLFGGEDSDDYDVNMEAFLGSDYDHSLLSDPLIVNWISIAKLKEYNHAYLIGGARDQCLKEVSLLMNAFNIKYTLINDLIYS